MVHGLGTPGKHGWSECPDQADPGAEQTVNAGNGQATPPAAAPAARQHPAWKRGLALVSLALSLLLWLNGLADSLSRPSVGGDLNLRQLELTVLAEPRVPAGLRPLLAGADPARTLDEALAREIERGAKDGAPAAAELRLERALLLLRLQRDAEARPLLQTLAAEPGPDSPEVAVARALLGEAPPPPRWPEQRSLLRQWSCEALDGAARCGTERVASRALAELLAVTVLPLVVLMVGIGLLLRELWLRWRRRSAPLPAIEGPPLSALDAVLLIAGGFVVVGELLTPLLLAPALEAVLRLFGVTSPLREGLTVLVSYLALMAGPLLILALMVRGLGPAPTVDGWLPFHWRPLSSSLGRALRGLLMVLPLVSLVGWLQSQLWGDPGGSNPLLDLVLRSQDPTALGCFALTAVVLAPLFEETLFRGVLLPVAARELGGLGGVLLSALVFAVAHLSLGELPPLFMLGLGLGWLRWSSGRLGCCVLMHALWNGLTFCNLVLLAG